MGIIGALVILVWARGLLRDTAKALLDREMDDPLVGKVREALERVPRRSPTCICGVWGDRSTAAS